MICRHVIVAHSCTGWYEIVLKWVLQDLFVLNMTIYSWITTTHYTDVIMGAVASQITSLTIVYSTVYSDADQRKHQSSASLAFVWGIHRGPVNSPQKWPVTRKMFPFDDVIMSVWYLINCNEIHNDSRRFVERQPKFWAIYKRLFVSPGTLSITGTNNE